jgi:putative salt-induced outer membrane protein YdiY
MSRPAAGTTTLLAVWIAVAGLATPAMAQDAPAPQVKHWFTTLSFGLTVTSGNKDTSTYSAGYDFKYDPKTKNVLKSDGLFIRGKTDGVVSTSRLSLRVRDEHQANGKFFVFAQAQYLQDTFKQIDYLAAPTAGMGIKAIDSKVTRLAVNLGVGGVWEKNTLRGVRRSGAVTLGQNFSHQLSSTVAITQSFNGLWKTEALHDALLTLGASLAASINSRTQFKVEWIDTYKTRPPSALVQKNDMSVLVALVVKH